MKGKLKQCLTLSVCMMLGVIHAQDSKKDSKVLEQKEIKHPSGDTFLTFGKEKENTISQDAASTFKPNGHIGFFVVGGYSFGLDDNTTGDGEYMADDSDETSNTFFLRYARVNGVFHISPKLQANLLMNLADFKKDDVSKKVLEIASVTYKHNKALNLRVGQFRPYFGIEDTYGMAKHKAYYWSNSYSLLGKSQWQSFQIGASLYGDLRDQNIPIKYYLNVYNGNGKNQIKDNDSNKNVSGRLLLMPFKGVEVGANYAFAKHLEEDIHAAAFDLKTYHDLSSQVQLNTEFSYSFGHNLGDAINKGVLANQLDDHKFRGWYFLPQLVYDLNSPNLKSLELSCRYEGLYDNLEDNKNLRTTISPLIGLNVTKDFKTSLVAVFDNYDEENLTQGAMDTSWMLLQLQFNY